MRVTKLRHERANRVSNPRGQSALECIPRSTSQAPAKFYNLPFTAYVSYISAITANRNRGTETLTSGHGAVTGASHRARAGRLSGLDQRAGETAVAPLMVHRPQVRAVLIEAMRLSAAVCGAAASGVGGVVCIGVITAGHACVFHLFWACCAPSAAAFLRFLCADDLLCRAVSLTIVGLKAGSVLGEGWCAEPARAGRAWHCFQQPLHERRYRAAERSGRWTVGIG